MRGETIRELVVGQSKELKIIVPFTAYLGNGEWNCGELKSVSKMVYLI